MFKMFKPISFFYNWYRQSLRHPTSRWWLLGGTLLWLLNPINTIPILGEIDEAIVIGILVTEVSQVLIEAFKNKRSGTEVAELKAEPSAN